MGEETEVLEVSMKGEIVGSILKNKDVNGVELDVQFNIYDC